jgi:hypothetical protein
MSYNYNPNQDFYQQQQSDNLRQMNFGDMNGASNGGNYFDPASYFGQGGAQNQAFMTNDWSQPTFFNPNDPQDAFGQKNATNATSSGGNNFVDDFENEPPLLEELGINFDHIYRKTKCVLNPFAVPHESIIHDEDLAGPLVFCIAYGFSLLLMGKIHFGYIYGITLMGCLSMYLLLNLMSERGVNAACIGSILGYCLLPMVILSFISVVLTFTGYLRLIVSLFFILWCSISSSKLFVHSLNMTNQQLLVLYPCFLLYGIFALLNVF